MSYFFDTTKIATALSVKQMKLTESGKAPSERAS